MPTYSTEQQRRLALLAAAAAIEAPLRSSAATAKIPWALIEKIRAVITEAGVDWRGECARIKRLNRHARWLALPAALRGPEPPRE